MHREEFVEHTGSQVKCKHFKKVYNDIFKATNIIKSIFSFLPQAV